MFTRLRTSTAAFAALIAVACAPTPVMAGPAQTEQRALCMDTAEVAGAIVEAHNGSEGQRAAFMEVFNALDPVVQQYLYPYLRAALLAAAGGYPAAQIQAEIFQVCMERKV